MQGMSAQPVKAMPLFFIDNQGAWPRTAELVGDLVVWPDAGRYPTYSPVAVASHPNFDGKVVVQAGNRGILMSFVVGAKTEDDIAAALGGKARLDPEKVQQYRIAVDALVHRLVMNLIEKEGGDEPSSDVDALALVAWMAKSKRSLPYARVISAALGNLLADPEALKQVTASLDGAGDAFDLAEAMITSLSMSASQAAASDPAGEQA
jgi:hypothetical protein